MTKDTINQHCQTLFDNADRLKIPVEVIEFMRNASLEKAQTIASTQDTNTYGAYTDGQRFSDVEPNHKTDPNGWIEWYCAKHNTSPMDAVRKLKFKDLMGNF
jgi:hypothetical protein